MRANKILDFDSTQDDFVRAVIYPIAMVDYEGFLRSISSFPSERKKKKPRKNSGLFVSANIRWEASGHIGSSKSFFCYSDIRTNSNFLCCRKS